MKYVQISVDNVVYTLRETPSGEWTVTNKAPYLAGEYPITVYATTEAGQTLQVNATDPELLRAMTLLVTEGTSTSGERMLNYYPEVIKKILEFQAFIKSEGFEVDFLKNDIELSVNEAYLTTMGEERISEWEKALGLEYSADDTLEDRRDAIIARIRGQGKLNTALINSIVSAFTGGTAESFIENSTLVVKIQPPPDSKVYKFYNVTRELSKKIPAHLGLLVTKDYATWGQVAENYTCWEAISQLDSWEELMLYLPPQ